MKCSKSSHIIPDALVGGMKNMRAIPMHHYASLYIAFGMTVATDMRAFVNKSDFIPLFCKMAGYDGSAKTGSDNTERQ